MSNITEESSKINESSIFDTEKFRSILLMPSENTILYDNYDTHFIASPLCICNININPEDQTKLSKSGNIWKPNKDCRCTFKLNSYNWNSNLRGNFNISKTNNINNSILNIKVCKKNISSNFFNIFGNSLNPKLFTTNLSYSYENLEYCGNLCFTIYFRV